MPSPFPGMDPYLERPQIWLDLHPGLIMAIRNALAPLLPRAYYVRVEQRTYIAEVELQARPGHPDVAVMIASADVSSSGRGGPATAATPAIETVVLPIQDEIRERYIEIRDAETHAVVTAIELLSPTNKLPGPGRAKYTRKRRLTLHSQTNLVEIDLLRRGRPMAMEPTPACPYRLLVSPAWERPEVRLSRFSIQDPIPEITIPLRRGEPEPLLSLTPLLADLYELARYEVSIDYRQGPPPPSLSPEDAAWVDELLRAAGRRA